VRVCVWGVFYWGGGSGGWVDLGGKRWPKGAADWLQHRSTPLPSLPPSNPNPNQLSVIVLKHGKKVVAGCQTGVLSIFSWGYWNDCSDRFPGHPESGGGALLSAGCGCRVARRDGELLVVV